MTEAEELGRAVREAREAAGLTQEQLAVLVETSRPTITALERGAIKYPKITMLTAIAVACDVPPSALLGPAGFSQPDLVDAQLQWISSELDVHGRETLIELGHALVRSYRRQLQTADQATARRAHRKP